MQIDVFGLQMEKFREILLGLIHCTAGQPACGTEITNITFENGISERNIFIERKLTISIALIAFHNAYDDVARLHIL